MTKRAVIIMLALLLTVSLTSFSLGEPAVPGPALPEIALPERVLPDAVLLEMALPERVSPDAVLADTDLPDAVLPGTALSDSALPETVAAEPIAPEPAAAAAAVHFVCGERQTGSFPSSMLQTATYTVYLQANKGVAFYVFGAGVMMATVLAPNGATVGTLTKQGYTSSHYGMFTTPNQSGNYTIQIQGCCGTYYVNCLTGHAQTSNTNTAYNRTNAVKYARDHANTEDYNPAYQNYHFMGGDCTNFVSQCVYAGGMPMITGSGTDAHWFYSSSGRSPSWTGADYFMRHWTKVRSSSYNGRAYSVRIYTRDYIMNHQSEVYNFISPGDIVQYLEAETSTAGHSHIITGKDGTTGAIQFCSHSADKKDDDWYTFVNDCGTTEWIVVIKIRNT